MPTEEPRLAGLTNTGKAKRLATASASRQSRAQRDVVYHRQQAFPADTLHHLLIHADGGGHHARAHVGQVGQLQQALHRAVLAEGAVQDGEDHVDLGLRARLGQDGARAPLAVLVDEVLQNLVPGGVDARHDGLGRADRNLVLAAAAAVNDGDSTLHRIRFPSADMTSSTARSAVRLTSSITGLTSTTSMDTMAPESQIISMAKCASR